MSPHRHREMKGTSDAISATSDEALWKESIKEEPPSWHIKHKNSRSLGCRRLPPFLLCLGLRCFGLALRPRIRAGGERFLAPLRERPPAARPCDLEPHGSLDSLLEAHVCRTLPSVADNKFAFLWVQLHTDSGMAEACRLGLGTIPGGGGRIVQRSQDAHPKDL